METTQRRETAAIRGKSQKKQAKHSRTSERPRGKDAEGDAQKENRRENHEVKVRIFGLY